MPCKACIDAIGELHYLYVKRVKRRYFFLFGNFCCGCCVKDESHIRDLSWVRKQGQIVEQEKEKLRQKVRILLKKKPDSFAELPVIFEHGLIDTEHVFRGSVCLKRLKFKKD